MPFIPHTEQDVREMLAAIGAARLEDLFDEIPAELRAELSADIPAGLNEMAVSRLMQARAAQDDPGLCFIGAGAYEHYIPAAVWQIVTRGEYYTAYTPYQAEASQGTLQLIYEYQSMMTALMAMDVSNASLYDGASALAEAVLMAVRANRATSSRRILVAGSLHPLYVEVTRSIVGNQNIELVMLPYDARTGHIDPAALDAYAKLDFAALVIPQPNFFGVLEAVDDLTRWAHAQQALAIAVVNPMAMAILKPPGEWGDGGVDIAVGEGQPLGVPMAGGGPYYGFMCCKQEHVRQMPGRIVGRTVDLEGKPGFTLTLQPREQHIRRSKATSNICTNQGLVVAASTIYMAMMGAQGLARVASTSHANSRRLLRELIALPGIEPLFSGSYFHEFVLRLPRPVETVLNELARQGIAGGYALAQHYPELGESLLVCATETKTTEDLELYVRAMAAALRA